jgi:hypothetical protein
VIALVEEIIEEYFRRLRHMDIQKSDRERFFKALSKEQQVNLVVAATDCYGRSSNHFSIEQTLNEMIDLILGLRGESE